MFLKRVIRFIIQKTVARACQRVYNISDEQEGGNLYLVGGAVRDNLLGKETHDEDYCVTGLSSEKFQEIFPEAYTRGKAFAVFDIQGKEFAMARTESKTGKGHKEFEIIANTEITIEEDLARRDITINSIAKDVLTGEIIDPFDGQKDLKNKINARSLLRSGIMLALRAELCVVAPPEI